MQATKERVLKSLEIDILLLLDCTSSMKKWIEKSKENLKEIINTVKAKSCPQAKVRVGYVGYRDFGDIGDEQHFDVLNFTEDIIRAKEKIGRS